MEHVSLAHLVTLHLALGTDDPDEIAAACSVELGRPVKASTVKQYRSHFRRWGPDWVVQLGLNQNGRYGTERRGVWSKTWADTTHPEADLLARVRNSASKRGIPFDLQVEDVQRLSCSMVCAVTGLPMTWKTGVGKPGPWKVSLDQIVPRGGYVLGNVRAVCWAANQFMGPWTLERARGLANQVLSNRDAGQIPGWEPENGGRLLETRPHGGIKMSTHLATERKKRRSTKTHALPFTIDRYWVGAELMRGTCEVTGLPLWWSTEKRDPQKPSIDRRDGSLGYTPANSRVTSIFFNMAKGDFDDSIFWRVAEAIT